MKEFIVKDLPHFRLKVRIWNCSSPSKLRTVEFLQECIVNGEVDFISTYQFFMTDEELKTLSEGLVNGNN